MKFVEKYQEEFNGYILSLKKQGSTVALKIEDPETEFLFKNDYVINLCNLFLQKKLSGYQINYIADILTISDQLKFQKGCFEILENFADPEINGILTEKYVRSVKNKLLSKQG